MLPNVLQQIREIKPKFVANIKAIIHNEIDPKRDDFLNDIRRTNTYNVLPKSMSDEDRLILTFHKYHLFWKPSNNANNNPEDAQKEFREMIRSDISHNNII